MNLFQLQERLKNYSQDQLVNEMQNPTGSAPQYLVLSELQRRKRMMTEEQAQMPQEPSVAEEAVAAAGVPQGGLAQMAQAMAPETDMAQNTARMAGGGKIRRDVYERNRPREMEEDDFRGFLNYEAPDDFRGRYYGNFMAAPEAEEDPFRFLADDPFGRSMRNARAAMRTRADEAYEADIRDALSAVGSDYEGMGARERSLREEDDDMRDMIESLMRSQSEAVGGFAEGGMIDRRIESMIADRYDEDVARRERRADELYEGARGEDREYGSGFLGRLLENLSERDDRANRRAADMLADPQGRNEIDREMADFMRSHSQTVGGFAEGGVVRMQPGGLAGISRDLRTYMNPNDRATALLNNPYVVQQAAATGMTPAEYASSLSRARSDALVAADLANQVDIAEMPLPESDSIGFGETPIGSLSEGDRVFTGEDQMFTPDSPLMPRPSGPTEFAPMEGTDPANLATVLGDLITGYDPEEVAQGMLDAGEIDQEQFNRFVFGSGSERERVARETLGLEEPRVPPEPSVTEAPDVTPDVDGGMRPEDRGFGRGMETPTPETGLTFGPELTAPEDDAIRTALSFGDLEAQREGTSPPAATGGAAAPAAGPASDDLFEQDKWLALAQFGLGLMTSQAPTFGQAFGEAGQAGISALMQAREDRRSRETAEQARADRLAAAAARSARDDEDEYPYRQIDDIINMAESYERRASDIVEENAGIAPRRGDPGYEDYINNLALANTYRNYAREAIGIQ